MSVTPLQAQTKVTIYQNFATTDSRLKDCLNLVLTPISYIKTSSAQHLAAEIVGRFEKERAGLAALALTTDTSTLTSIANDYGFDYIFSRQVEALGNREDVLCVISTSGNSTNIIEAVKAAKAKGITTIGLFGNSGGELKMLVDHALIVPSDNTARIQEAHILIGHILCQLIEESLFS